MANLLITLAGDRYLAFVVDAPAGESSLGSVCRE
jgi:hypothetical protein